MTVSLEVYDGTAWIDKTSKMTEFRHSITSRELESIEFTLVDDDVGVGQRVRARLGINVFFEGVVYERRKRNGGPVVYVDATAYSDLIRYDRHVVYRLYETGTTAGDIIRDLASLESGVDVTNVDDGPALNSPWEIQNESALEVMRSVARGTNHYLRMKPGLILYFKPKTETTPTFTITSSNTLSAEYSEDRWRLKNRVIYVGAGGEVLADVSEPPGDLPVVVHDPFLTDEAEAERRARIRLALNKEYGRELRVVMRDKDFEASGIDLFSTVTVNLPSLGLSNVDMYVVEISYDPREKTYELLIGGRRELLEEFLDEAIGGDVAARFGQSVSVAEAMGSLLATVTTLQAAQRIQAQGRTVRLINRAPMLYENGSNITLDSDGSIRLISGATSGSFEFSCLPPSELFTRWLRTQYFADLGEGSVTVDLQLADGTTLFSRIPPDFDVPYFPSARGAATNDAIDWDATNATVTTTDQAIIGLVAIRADKTGSTMTLVWPKTRDANFDILRYFRIYFYTFDTHDITIRLMQDASNYLSATVSNEGGLWRRWDISTASMTKTGNPTEMNWLEITTDAPTLLIDSDYLFYPAGREKLVLKCNLSRPNASATSPKIQLLKFVWREGKT